MNSKAKYNYSTLPSLHGVNVVVSTYVKDNQIVLRAPKKTRNPNHPYAPFASYHLSIWDLDKGEVSGDCPLTSATEMHMSPSRYDQMKKMIDENEKDEEVGDE